MNEIEWHRTLRTLRQPVPPAHDLWPAIAAAIDEPTPETTHAGRRPWLLAAMLAGAFALAGGIGAGLHSRAGHAPAETAVTPVPPSTDPRLRGAFIELDATRDVLHDAMRQNPDSPLLRRLLARTERQQTQLRHLAHEAG